MKSTITIGRSSHCDIIIPHASISREHARISLNGGRYIYENIGRNGSVLGGRIIYNEKIVVAPGAEILLAGKIPLPWSQVYAMLPMHGVQPYDNETRYDPIQSQVIVQVPPIQQYKEDNIGIGYGILAFLIPIAGWIMYFVWKDSTPHRASQANTLAWIGFILNLICFWASM